MKYFRSSILILFIYLFSYSVVFSGFTLEIQRIGGIYSDIDVKEYPKFKAKIRASIDSIPVKLDPSQVMIIEDNIATVCSQTSQPDGQGWQIVSWITGMRSKTLISDQFGTIPDTLRITAVYNNQSAYAEAELIIESISYVSFLNVYQDQIKELDFSGIIPPNSDSKTFHIFPQAARKINDFEQIINVDSVRLSSKEFIYFDFSSPPFTLISPFTHEADIIYKPKTTNYFRDKLTVYYDRGKKSVLNLTANNFNIPKNTYLTLLQPNGGEILTPCQTYEIKWRGHQKDIPVIIEYTTDLGVTWTKLASVVDSSYIWKVPNEISEAVYMRIRQELSRDFKTSLNAGDNVFTVKAAYDPNTTKILSANLAGKIYEWDLSDFQVKNTYTIPSVRYPGEITMPKNIVFISNNRFVVAYNKYTLFPNGEPDTLAFFTLGKSTPDLVTGMGAIKVKDIFVDSQNRFIAILQELDNKILLYSTIDGSFIKSVDFIQPVTAFNFNPLIEEATAILLNGDVCIMQLPGFGVKKIFNISDIPYITKIGLSPNGNYIAAGCKHQEKPEYTGNIGELHIIDTESEQIVRTMRKTASEPLNLAFNKTSSIVVAGMEAQPQIAFWDLPTDDYAGSIQGNQGVLTDMKIAPDGFSILAVSLSEDNLTYRTFSYPESDYSDGFFKIVKPKIEIQKIIIDSNYISNSRDYKFSNNFCNSGLVDIVIETVKFKNGIHFRLNQPINLDTVSTDECLQIFMNYTPRDTGNITDTLVLLTCAGEYSIPIESYSFDRNISFYQDPFDFGEVCLGETLVKDIIFARNNDTIPLKVNYVTTEGLNSNNFSVIDSPLDSIINPGDFFPIRLMFSPDNVGKKSSRIYIYHSDQLKIKPSTGVIGTGIGTEVEISHKDLRFIPEILTRNIRVKNKSNNLITITKLIINPPGNFTVLTPIPFDLNPLEEREISVQWSGNRSEDSLIIEAIPCIRKTKVILAPYNAISNINIPIIEADPRDSVSIPVKFSNLENKPYNGIRSFSGGFDINPRMFLPFEVVSKYGTGSLTRNEIINDRRVVEFRIEGDFDDEGVVAEVKGIAGIAETDTSTIALIPNLSSWGTAVTTKYTNGLLKLINLCGDRRVYQPVEKLVINSILPNPTNGKFEVNISSSGFKCVIFSISDELGNLIYKNEPIDLNKGDFSFIIDLTEYNLITGLYRLSVSSGAFLTTYPVVLIR